MDNWQSAKSQGKIQSENQKQLQNNLRFFLVFIFLSLFLFFYFHRDKDENFLYQNSQNSEIKLEFEKQNLKLEAKAVYVYDILEKKPLFELNADVQFPLASLAKIMTAIVAEEKIPFTALITKEAILQEGDDNFIVDENWQAPDLLDAMLISSSNDAAFALASNIEKYFEKDFVFLMNEKSKELNLEKTYFLNATGLDLNENISGAYGSAKDISRIILYILEKKPVLMDATRFESLNINSRDFKNTNIIVNDLPGLIIGKTGYSDLAGGNLAVVAEKGYQHPFIIVVLGSTFNGRFEDVKKLYNLIP